MSDDTQNPTGQYQPVSPLEQRLLGQMDRALACVEQDSRLLALALEEMRAVGQIREELAAIRQQLRDQADVRRQVTRNTTEIGKLEVKAGFWGAGAGVVAGLALTVLRGCSSTAQAAQPGQPVVESVPWAAMADVIITLIPFGGLGALLLCLVGLSAYGQTRRSRVRWYPRAPSRVEPAEVERAEAKTEDVLERVEDALEPADPVGDDWRDDIDAWISEQRKRR